MKNFLEKIRYKKHLLLLILFSGLHSLLILFISLWLVNQHIVYGDERFLFQITAGIKKIVLGLEKKPSVNDYIFINNSFDNMLIQKYDEEGFPVGNQPITDRKKLSYFFEKLNKRPDSYKYIVCDVFFKDSSSYDSLLYSNLKNTKNIIIPYHLNDSGEAINPVFDINKGLADYRSVQNIFMKYRLAGPDSSKSLPLKMYEDLTGIKYEQKSFLSYIGGRPCFSTIVIDFKLRQYELMDRYSEPRFNLVNLGEFLKMNDSVFYKSVNNKIILMGDFYEHDIHRTLFGKMSGTLILLNAYLSLVEKENLINFGLFLLLFIGFFIISLEIFLEKNLRERKNAAKRSQKKFSKFIIKYISFVLYLTILSVVAYFVFNIHLNILILSVYFKSLDSFLKYLKKRKNKKVIITAEFKNEN